MINCWCAILDNDLKGLLLNCWCCITFVLLWIVPYNENDNLFIIYVNMSFALLLRHNCEKCSVIRGCTILMDVSRTTMDAWTYMFLMHSVLWDTGRVALGQTCIMILDIALHLFIIGELDLPYCLSVELVIDQYLVCCWIYKFLECCCWGYEIVRLLLLKIWNW